MVIKDTVNKAVNKDEIIDQLRQQNRFLTEQLYKRNSEDFFKRMDYLFKVLDHASLFAELDKQFLIEVATEIMSVIKIDAPEETKEPVDIEADTCTSSINE